MTTTTGPTHHHRAGGPPRRGRRAAGPAAGRIGPRRDHPDAAQPILGPARGRAGESPGTLALGLGVGSDMTPLARYAAITGYADLCASLGMDPTPLLRGVGLHPAGLGLPDRWIPAVAIARLLQRSATVTRCPDFGLRLVERRRFAHLGPVSLVLREEPDVRSALKFLMRYQHMYNEALRMRLVEAEDVATIRVALEVGEPADTRQGTELALGVLYRLLRDFRGGRWQSLAVCFTHLAPEDTSAHREVFGPMVKFDQEFTGIVLHTSDLDAPNTMSGPSFGPYARQFVDTLDTRPEATPVTRVRQLIELLLPTGRCSVEQVARSLGVDRRTVTSKRPGRPTPRCSTPPAWTSPSTSSPGGATRSLEVADLLGFSSASNFSRWFRNEFGSSPEQWRRAPHRGVSTRQGADTTPCCAHPERRRRSSGPHPVACVKAGFGIGTRLCPVSHSACPDRDSMRVRFGIS